MTHPAPGAEQVPELVQARVLVLLRSVGFSVRKAQQLFFIPDNDLRSLEGAQLGKPRLPKINHRGIDFNRQIHEVGTEYLRILMTKGIVDGAETAHGDAFMIDESKIQGNAHGTLSVLSWTLRRRGSWAGWRRRGRRIRALCSRITGAGRCRT